jgi:threonine dehydrogenase-like Zn-dependent dehydrogenase
VAVWGGGKVGLMARQSAYLLDTERVIAIGRLPERLQMATEKVGAKTIDYTPSRQHDQHAKGDDRRTWA